MKQLVICLCSPVQPCNNECRLKMYGKPVQVVIKGLTHKFWSPEICGVTCI